MNKISKYLVVGLAAIFLLTEKANANPAGSGKSVPAIVADVLICRPLGLCALVAGSAFYVVSLPFTIPAGGQEEAKRNLVMYPYHYTFTRQLGEFQDDDL
jgi:hypothetical protein